MRVSWFVILLITGLFLMTGVSQAGPLTTIGPDWWLQDYHWCPDPTNDAAGGNDYEVLRIGYTIAGAGYLVVAVDTNFPIAGLNGRDSYTNNAPVSPGDLYINVGGMFQMGTGFQFGVVTEPNPGGVDKTADPTDGPWESTFAPGDLTIETNFATGTFEGYPTGTPSDGNDGDGVNDYPTLIMNYLIRLDAGPHSGFHYDGSTYYYYARLQTLDDYSEQFGNTNLLDANGNLINTIQLTWAMECGNDLAEYKIEIPEPTTVALVGAGVAAMAARRRRSIL